VPLAGLARVASIEPKPGVPPTAAVPRALVGKLTDAPPKLILLNAYNDPKAASWLSERIHAPRDAAVLGGGSPEAKDLFGCSTTPRQTAGGSNERLTTDFSILLPALIAGCLVAISHVPLGSRCCRAASCSSISPSRRWPRSA
jgi:hypothetical protein